MNIFGIEIPGFVIGFKEDLANKHTENICSTNVTEAVLRSDSGNLFSRRESVSQAALPKCLLQSIGDTRGRPMLLIIGAGSQRCEELDDEIRVNKPVAQT